MQGIDDFFQKEPPDILIVDDAPDSVLALSHLLEERGIKPRTALSGAEALEAVRDRVPDLIALDIRMPEMDGFEVCRRLKKDPAAKDAPVMFISALEDAEDKVRAFAAGGADYITKPYQEAEVMARISAHLKLGAMHRRLESAVKRRTAELSHRTRQLQKEVEERKKAVARKDAALKEKNVLLSELYHRAKNNMQVICSMLRLQSEKIADARSLTIFRDVENRILTMSLVHDKLYQSQDLSNINLREYLEDLIDLLRGGFGKTSENAVVKLDCRDMPILIDMAIPIGLVLNELISNALKYAFPEGRPGEVLVRVRKSEDGILHIRVSDNGAGPPEWADFDNPSTFGVQTVAAIVRRQLNGRLSFSADRGLTCRMSFPADLYPERL